VIDRAPRMVLGDWLTTTMVPRQATVATASDVAAALS